MKVLVVDNESGVRDSIVRMLEQFCPAVTEVQAVASLAETRRSLSQSQPDLLLLDVELDDGTGFDLLKELDAYSFQVVFVTAHNRYAVDAFRLSAMDFLLKPLDPVELQEAVAKAKDKIWLLQQAKALSALQERISSGPASDKRIALRGQDAIHLVRPSDILYCQADGVYTNFLLSGGRQVVISRTLKEYEELLHPLGFMRVHNSYLVNMDHVEGFKKNDGGFLLLESGIEIPVSQRKREAVMAFFKRF